MRLNSLRIFLFGLIWGIMNRGTAVYAQFTFKNPIQAQSFGEVVQRVASILVKIGIPLASIFLVYSGFLFVSARGDEKQLETAKKTFWWTIIGTALIVGAYAIASAIVEFAQKL